MGQNQYEVIGYVRGVGNVTHVVGATTSSAAASAVKAMYGDKFTPSSVRKLS
jgi:hypothetical protein